MAENNMKINLILKISKSIFRFIIFKISYGKFFFKSDRFSGHFITIKGREYFKDF